MKSFSAVLAAVVCSLPAPACSLSAAPQANQVVNVAASSSTGTTVKLNAGTYQVSVVGKKGGGAYDGWDFATSDYTTKCGKASSAQAASNDWVDSFAILANGTRNSYVASGNPSANSASAALADYESSILYTNGTAPASSKVNTAFFTLNSAQSVTFTAADNYFCDNWGGVSLAITPVLAKSEAAATPEPSTFGLIGIVLAGAAAAAFRKRRVQKS